MKALFMNPEPLRMESLNPGNFIENDAIEPGLYEVITMEDNMSHLVLVYRNKSNKKMVFFLGPSQGMKLPLKDAEEIFPGKKDSVKQEFSGLVSESFALEFSKILLNRK